MSAEGKKKRGAAGLTNAQNIPFRGNGRASDWKVRDLGCYRDGGSPSSGSVTMRGLLGGNIAAALGYEMYGNFSDKMVGHAIDRCTHSLLKD